MKRFFLILLLFIISCAPKYSQPAINSPSFELKTVYVDDRFAPNEKYLIQRAILAWTVATNNILMYNVQYANLSIYDNELETTPLKDTGTVITTTYHGSNKLMIIKTYSNTKFIHNAQNIVSSTAKDKVIICGLEFDWKGYNVIAIVPNKIKDDKTFEATVLHELGHSSVIGDHINNKPSVMSASPEDSSGCITETDVQLFCSLYHCNWHEMHYCKK